MYLVNNLAISILGLLAERENEVCKKSKSYQTSDGYEIELEGVPQTLIGRVLK